MNTYNVEITDLFAGELNYSYITRMTIEAKSLLGAIRKVSNLTGLNFRKYHDLGSWEAIYHSTSKLTGVYITETDGE